MKPKDLLEFLESGDRSMEDLTNPKMAYSPDPLGGMTGMMDAMAHSFMGSTFGINAWAQTADGSPISQASLARAQQVAPRNQNQGGR